MFTVITSTEQKTETLQNAKQLPVVMYGRHFSPGVAEYRPPGESPYRVLVNESTIRAMDASFAGRPVYVGHVDDVNLDAIQLEADGYVVRSFFNAADSCHWVEMLIVSDKGHRALASGCKLSNAYKPMKFAPGGESKGVAYQREVMAAEYEHLALVHDPRYEDSVILTPEAFKAFNEEKLSELTKLQNSKDETKEKPFMAGLFEFFKRTKVEGDALSPDTIVKLPKSGKEVSLETLINAADEMEAGEAKTEPEEKAQEAKEQGDAPEAKDAEAAAAPKMANEEDHVAHGEGTISVKELKARHDKMQDCMNTLSEMASKPKEEKPAEEAKAEEAPKEENSDDTESQPSQVLGDGRMANSVDHFKSLKNAALAAPQRNQVSIGSIALGKAKYGSN